ARVATSRANAGAPMKETTSAAIEPSGSRISPTVPTAIIRIGSRISVTTRAAGGRRPGRSVRPGAAAVTAVPEDPETLPAASDAPPADRELAPADPEAAFDEPLTAAPEPAAPEAEAKEAAPARAYFSSISGARAKTPEVRR